MEDHYEHIEILIRTPDTNKQDDSWFDRIFDFITSFCEPVGEVDEDGNSESCTCGMESMSGGGGTLDQCYDHMRITEKWAFDVQVDDLKLALHRLAADEGMDDAAYERLRKAAYWHDDFNDWVANLPDDEEEDNDED